MKKTKQVEYNACDSCNNDEYAFYTCRGCGKSFCFSCREKQGVEYKHSLFCSGTGDGYYCNKCNAEKLGHGNDPVFNCYAHIKTLRRQYEILEEELKEAGKRAEENLKRLLNEHPPK